MTLEGWNYRKSHIITHPTGGLTNYQTKIRVYRTTGTDSGDAVYVGDKCRADYGDIRFTNSAGTELDYWMETNAGSYADFWVELDTVGTTTTIYVYYGNSSATTTSNGDTTFIEFDDFSINTIGINWTENASYTGKSTYMATHTIENNGYHAYQPTAADCAAGLIRTTPLSNVSICHITMTYTSRAGRSPPWCYFCLGYNSSIITYGYWGTVLLFNPNSPSDTLDLVWTDGKTTNNINFYRNGTLVYTGSASYATNKQPSFLVRTAGSETINLYYKNFYVRKYDATEPTHSTWGAEQDLSATSFTIRITPTTGTDPLSVTYNCIIPEGTLDNFILDYGDGNEYTAATQSSFATTHTYNEPGTYTVWAEGYTEFATHVYYELPYGVTVNAEAVVASFSVDQTYNTVTFTNTSTGNINECYWDFGDDNHSYEQNPIHTYWSPATYTVTLYASNQYQYDTYTTTVTVTQILTPPEVYFTPNNLNVINPALPYTVNFTNLSTPAFGCTYNWLIDGVSYTTQNTSHSFATYGMYDVGLTVTNALGSATKTYNNAIRITRKSKTFYEVINYADTPATFHVEVFNEVATSADTVIQAHIFDESINFVQDEIPDEPGLDEWGMRHFYSSINEWGHRIISAVTDWGNRILYNGSTLDNSPVTLFKAQEFREDVVFIDEWQFGTT